MSNEIRMTVRLPLEVAAFLDSVSGDHFTSRNAEIVRAVHERMAREGWKSPVTAAGVKFGDQAPAAAGNRTALQGGAIINPDV